MSDVQEQERWDLSLIRLTILSGAAMGRDMGGDMSCRRRHDDYSIDTAVAWLPRAYDLVAGGRARSYYYYSEQAYDLAESIAGGRSTLVGGYGGTVYPTVAWSSINRPPPLLCARRRREIAFITRYTESKGNDLCFPCWIDPDSTRSRLCRPGNTT